MPKKINKSNIPNPTKEQLRAYIHKEGGYMMYQGKHDGGLLPVVFIKPNNLDGGDPDDITQAIEYHWPNIDTKYFLNPQYRAN